MGFMRPMLEAMSTGAATGGKFGAVGSGLSQVAGGGTLGGIGEGLSSFGEATVNPFATLTGGSEIGQALDMLHKISNPLQMAQLAPLPQSQVFAVPKRLRRRLGG